MKFLKFSHYIITYLLALFIFGAIGTVLVKGAPILHLAIQNAEIWFAVKLSLYTSAVSTILSFIVALPVAYLLARKEIPGHLLVVNILRIPLNLPPIVSGVSLLLLFGTTPFGRLLEHLGVQVVFSELGIIIAQFFINVPGLITVLIAAIESVDIRLEYIARTLGYNPLQAFTKVTLPLIRNGMIAGLILTWGKALGEFGAVLMLAGATRFKTETLPISLYLHMSTGDIEGLMVIASILILISVISMTLFENARGKTIKRRHLQ